MMDRKKHGFTLIELLVVISIIAVLLSILMPALSRVKEVTKRTICGSNLKQMAYVVHTYANDFDGKFPVRQDLWSPNYYAIEGYLAGPGATPTAAHIAHDGRVIFDGYLPDYVLGQVGVADTSVDRGAQVMWCPSANATHMGYGVYGAGKGTWPDHRTDGYAGYYTSYQYFVCGEPDVNYDSTGTSRPLDGIRIPESTEDPGTIPLFGDTATWYEPGLMWRIASHFRSGAKEFYIGNLKPEGINNAMADASVKWFKHNEMNPYFHYLNDPTYVELWGGRGPQ